MTYAPGLGRRLAHDPGDPLITSHCPFCGSGQVAGRSDGTIACDFCGQNYIVRVQPAFPGSPQMPGPGMAPSDIGPDGGVTGPDGVPLDGGMPPGEDDGEGPPGDEEEAGPPGAASGGEGPPPPAGGSKKNSNRSSRRRAARPRTASSPLFPVPGNMRPQELRAHLLEEHGIDSPHGRPEMTRLHGSAHATARGYTHGHGQMPAYDLDQRDKDFLKGTGIDAYGSRHRYRGLGGQDLTEDQFIRHMGAALSGGHPAVLARLRAEAGRSSR